MSKRTKSKYWDIRPILAIPAQYRIIFGERSNGKTYGTLKYCLEKYKEDGSQFGYVRRWPDDIKKAKMLQLFSSLTNNEEIGRIFDGRWNGIRYNNGAFYLTATDGEETVQDTKPCGYVFAISAMEHLKSISYPEIRTILFDEFISRISYIPDEFALFMNLLSTIIRDRDDVDIFMLGNTVSKDCPYFHEMGLKHIAKQQSGTIDTYSYRKNDQEMLIAVEYTKNIQSKKSDKYFIFDNPKMEMITGGAWELAIYPHLFEQYYPHQVAFKFFIIYRQNTLQCEIIEGSNGLFIYVHQKTSNLRDPDNDLIYCVEPNSRRNWKVDITRPEFTIEKRIAQLITQDKICFQDNEIGEVFNDYLKWCRQHNAIKR